MNYTAEGHRERYRPVPLFMEGYRDTSLDKGTGPVQGGVQRVQPCTGGRGCTGLHRGTGLYRGAGLYREGYMGTSLGGGGGTGLYREG